MYAQRKRLKWVRERQDEEEAARVKESEVVKKDARFFKEQWRDQDYSIRKIEVNETREQMQEGLL